MYYLFKKYHQLIFQFVTRDYNYITNTTKKKKIIKCITSMLATY